MHIVTRENELSTAIHIGSDAKQFRIMRLSNLVITSGAVGTGRAATRRKNGRTAYNQGA